MSQAPSYVHAYSEYYGGAVAMEAVPLRHRTVCGEDSMSSAAYVIQRIALTLAVIKPCEGKKTSKPCDVMPGVRVSGWVPSKGWSFLLNHSLQNTSLLLLRWKNAPLPAKVFATTHWKDVYYGKRRDVSSLWNHFGC